MPNKNIFCNVPWTNLHMYWNGSYGVCCSESEKPYDESLKLFNHHLSEVYNIKNMSINEWFNSDLMKELRQNILGQEPINICSSCYFEESFNYQSRRIKENFKSVIFIKQFEKSYKQSHWFNRFESAHAKADQALPIDWHIDLGNECNLACKMCKPEASSKIAGHYKTWNILDKNYKNNSWTNDSKSFQNFLKEIDSNKIHRLHFMGGEPFANKRFRDIISYLVNSNRLEISISFVTNGTIIDNELIDQLQLFRSFDLEVSIESVDASNHYIRQGSQTDHVLTNILQLKEKQTNNFNIVLRTVPQLLSINSYHKLIDWAWFHKLPIQGIPLSRPYHLSIELLPQYLKDMFIQNLYDTADKIKLDSTNNFKQLAIGRDKSRLDIQLLLECTSLIELLKKPEPKDLETPRKRLAEWLMLWDKTYKLNAYEFYPVYYKFLKDIGYEI